MRVHNDTDGKRWKLCSHDISLWYSPFPSADYVRDHLQEDILTGVCRLPLGCAQRNTKSALLRHFHALVCATS